MKLRHDLVLLEWDDASPVLPGWQLPEEIKAEAQVAYTIGFCIKRSRDHIIISSTFDDSNATNHHFQLPRKMIRKQIVLAKRGSTLASLFPPTEPQHADTTD